MNQPPHAPRQPPPPPIPKARRPRRWPWILGMAGTLVVGIIIGAGSSGNGTPTPAAAPSSNTAPAATAPATQKPAAPSGPATSFGDGTFKVGEDIAPGSYKTNGPRSGSPTCYWARLADDSGNNIIANDNSQGATRFTTKKGEYVQIIGCDFVQA